MKIATGTSLSDWKSRRENLVLQIMDAQNLIMEERFLDSFPCGFKLAWELAYELNHFKMDRPPFPSEEAEKDA